MSEAQETSDYPGSLDTWTTLTDKEDLSEASDLNKIKAAIEAVQTELGTNPAGSETDLVARLAVSLANSGALAQGTSDPGSAVIGQPLYRTDTDQFKIYDGSAWDVIGPSAITIVSATAMSATTNSGDITITTGKLYRVLISLNVASADSDVYLRFASDSSAAYEYLRVGLDTQATPAAVTDGGSGVSQILLGSLATSGGNYEFLTADLLIDTTAVGAFDARVTGNVMHSKASTATMEVVTISGLWAGGTLTDFEIVSSSGNLTGNVYLYELALSA